MAADEFTFDQRVLAIAGLEESTEHWYHERYFAQMLAFGDFDNGGAAQLDKFIKRLKKGGTGAKKEFVKNHSVCKGVVDVSKLAEENGLNLYQDKWGRKKGVNDRYDLSEPTEYVAAQQETFYTFGRPSESKKIPTLAFQVDMIKEITGLLTASDDDEYTPSTIQRRRDQWRACLLDMPGGEDYAKCDLPVIIIKYSDILDVEIKPEWEADDVPDDVRVQAKAELVSLLQYSYVLPPTGSVSIMTRSSKRLLGIEDDNEADEAEGSNKRLRRRSGSLSPVPPDTHDDLPQSTEPLYDGSEYDLGNIRKRWNEGDYEHVGWLEMTLKSARDGEDLATVNETIRRYRSKIISSEEYTKIQCIPRGVKTRYLYNFQYLRKELLEQTPMWLKPFDLKDEDDLLKWWSDGQHYKAGDIFAHGMLDKNFHLTMAAIVAIRHIIFSFNIALSVFPALLNCFAVLLLGRELSRKEFCSVRTIRNHMTRLTIIDDHLIAQDYEKTFRKKQPYGFMRFFYTATDGTVHGKDAHHVIVRSGDSGPPPGVEDDGFKIFPFFDCLSTAQSASKNWKDDVIHNLEALKDACSSLEVLSMCLGNTSDNAAIKEGQKTFEAIQEYLISNGRDLLTMLYGVARWAIILSDPFHCCNLAIQHASEKGLGKTEKGNNRQIHHRQAMQTLHDIVSSDKMLAQIIADQVLENTGLTYTIKTYRERIQRWLINGRNAKKILEGYDLEIPGAQTNFWVLWALRYLPLASGWKRTALEEVIVFFMMPEIIVGLQFEAELVDYFEVTYQWHAYPGELCDRPGFRTMELHQLLFEHIMPFWEGAIQTPETRFERTFERIDKIEDQEKREMKRDQIKHGIQAGYDEIAKLYQTLMKAPMVFLATLDPKDGPSIFRAILALVEEEGVDIDRQDTHYDDEGVPENYGVAVDDDEVWGKFAYDDPDDRPEVERIWYDWLKDDSANLAHWWEQLGLCRRVVISDLKKLSKAEETELPQRRSPASSTRLHDFFVHYPVLFAAYRAVFALLPSASRIVESAHGIVRYSYDPQVPAKYLNAKMRYKMMIDHDMREKRRKMVREKREEKRKREEGGEGSGQKDAGQKRNAAKDADRKETQQMVGKQLLELIDTYSAKMVSELPERVKTKIQVRTVNKASATSLESGLQERKKEVAESLREKRQETREEKSFEDLVEIAETARTEHDKGWAMLGDRAEMVVLRSMLTKTWWQSVRAADFHAELTRVIPSFDHRNETKSKILKKGGGGNPAIDLGAHLKKIEAIAKKTVENDINDEDVANKSEDDILRMFIKSENSQVQESSETQKDAKKKKLGRIFKRFGTALSTRVRFTAERAYARQKEVHEDGNDVHDNYDGGD